MKPSLLQLLEHSISYQQTPIHNRPTNNGKYKHQHSNKYISEKERSDKDFPLDSF